ncbi:MAG TPA: hypothetical protein VFO40_21600 [Chthoniobacterales bacterium]|nr:hypothetical protein [Chthoniobacterales bacterium]
MSSRSHSLNGRWSGLVCGEGRDAFGLAREEGTGLVKTATLDADQLVVKAPEAALIRTRARGKRRTIFGMYRPCRHWVGS